MTSLEAAAHAVSQGSLEALAAGMDRILPRILNEDDETIILRLGVFYDAARRISREPDVFFMDYAQSRPSLKEHISDFVSRSEEDKLLRAFGLKAVDTPEFHYEYCF